MLKDFLHLVYPETCVCCEDVLPSAFKHLCPTCTQLLPLIEPGSNDTLFKLAGRVKIESAYSFLKFNKSGMAQKILHELKYKNNSEIGFFIGQKFGNYLLNQHVDLPKDGLIPVPLHPKRMKERGYNQAQVIAEGIAQTYKVDVHNTILTRTKEGLSQTRKGRSARLENMKDCFSLFSEVKLNDMHFGLVDDVITTGATLEACCLCLEKAGVGSVTVLSIANA